MFDSLSTKLQNAFRNLRGLGKISEGNVSDSLREVRMALLDADVNFKVARDFIERVKTKALGAEVIASVQPGQQIIKIIHDELVELLGSQNAALEISGNPACIMLAGLHGAGKTTSAGKLARLLKKQGGRLPSGGDGPARNARQTTGDSCFREARRDRRFEDCPRGARPGQGKQLQHAHLRHRRAFAD
jgi:signal recognition particle GTPase